MKYILMIALFAQISIAQPGTSPDPFITNKKSLELANGMNIKYVDAGDPNGTVLLLLHGYTDTSRSFQLLIEELLKLDSHLRILAPDLRGHGGSSMPAHNDLNGFTFKVFADDILDFMTTLGIENAHLVGHSMGSLIAQEMGLNHPEKIASLSLLGTSANCKDNIAVRDFLKGVLLDGWEQELMTTFSDGWRSKSAALTPKDLGNDVIEFLMENWVVEVNTPDAFLNSIYLETIETPLGTWFGALEEIGKFDNREQLAGLKVPTLILWGEGDVLFPKNPDQDQLLAACGQANKRHGTTVYFISYGRAGHTNQPIGHNLHWGIPKEIAEDILTFIRQGNPDKKSIPGIRYSVKDSGQDPEFQKTEVGQKGIQ